MDNRITIHREYTCASPIVSFITNNTDYRDIFWITKGIIILIFIFSLCYFHIIWSTDYLSTQRKETSLFYLIYSTRVHHCLNFVNLYILFYLYLHMTCEPKGYIYCKEFLVEIINMFITFYTRIVCAVLTNKVLFTIFVT